MTEHVQSIVEERRERARTMTAADFARDRCISCSNRRRGYRCRGRTCRDVLAHMPPGAAQEVEAIARRERMRSKMDAEQMVEVALGLIKAGKQASARPLLVEAATLLTGKKK